MRNVYVVRLAGGVKLDCAMPHFGSRETSHLYVVASGFPEAQAAVARKHPGARVRGIELLNYDGVPIVVGD